MAWVSVVSTAGGVLGGDDLSVSIDVGRGALLHVDTPSATRLYRTPGRPAHASWEISVRAGGVLELLPEATIPFAGSRFGQSVRCEVADDGVLAIADVVAAGRVAAGERFGFHSYESRLDVSRPGGALVVRDVLRLTPPGEVARVGLLGGHAAVGTLVVLASGVTPLHFGPLTQEGGVYGGASTLPNGAGAWLRVLAPQTRAAVDACRAAWSRTRQTLLGAPSPPPRRF